MRIYPEPVGGLPGFVDRLVAELEAARATCECDEADGYKCGSPGSPARVSCPHPDCPDITLVLCPVCAAVQAASWCLDCREAGREDGRLTVTSEMP